MALLRVPKADESYKLRSGRLDWTAPDPSEVPRLIQNPMRKVGLHALRAPWGLMATHLFKELTMLPRC
eukprot:3319239-Pyramimonas_sp.AAC.1